MTSLKMLSLARMRFSRIFNAVARTHSGIPDGAHPMKDFIVDIVLSISAASFSAGSSNMLAVTSVPSGGS